MKRYLRPLWALLLAVLLASCRPDAGEAPVPPEAEEPLRLESLSIEVSRGDASTRDLARTVRELPEALKEALAAQGVEVETVAVSVGSAPAATAQAVSEGGVDLAFLPAEDFAALEAPPPLLLAAGPAAGDADAGEEEQLYAFAAVVRPDEEILAGGDFAAALAAAVNSFAPANPVFGPYPYTPVEEDASDAQQGTADLD